MFEQILTALDGSEHDVKTLAAAKDLARLSGGQVRVFHVWGGHSIDRTGFGPNDQHDHASRLVDAAVADLVAAGLQATGTVRSSPSGLVATEILKEAEESGASVIVMGSRGRGDLKGLLMGSTAHKVLQRGRLPVLVIR